MINVGDKMYVYDNGKYTGVNGVIIDISPDETICIKYKTNDGWTYKTLTKDQYYGSTKYSKNKQNKNKVAYRTRFWSEWQVAPLEYVSADGAKRIVEIEFRTNNKTTQMRTKKKDNRVKASSFCCKDDVYDFQTGYKLARLRLIAKLVERDVEKFARGL